MHRHVECWRRNLAQLSACNGARRLLGVSRQSRPTANAAEVAVLAAARRNCVSKRQRFEPCLRTASCWLPGGRAPGRHCSSHRHSHQKLLAAEMDVRQELTVRLRGTVAGTGRLSSAQRRGHRACNPASQLGSGSQSSSVKAKSSFWACRAPALRAPAARVCLTYENQIQLSLETLSTRGLADARRHRPPRPNRSWDRLAGKSLQAAHQFDGRL